MLLYLWIGKLGSENLQADKLLSLQINAQDALEQKRPDLALKYFDKALKTLGDSNDKARAAVFHEGRGLALSGLKRCPEAQKEWKEACQLGRQEACKRTCSP